MSQNFLVSLLLRARDELSGPASRAFQNLKRESQEASTAFQRLSQASIRAAEQRVQAEVSASETATRANETSLSKRLRDYQRFNRAYETLGLRSEAEIQREISRTEAAYQRLARSGAMSAEEQARAFQKMTQTVAELNREMGKLSRSEAALQKFQGGARFVRGVGEGILGAAGAMHAVAEPVKETMSFDRRVAMMANTAYNERDVAGRISGEAEIRGAIRNSILKEGGNLEQITETLDQLLSHNAMSHEQVFRLLPILQRYATAEGADPNDLGNVAFKGVQTFGLKEQDVNKSLDMMIRGGHLGGFKLPDMSKWLPQQMAIARNSGLSGLDGLASLISLNELSYTTAGSVDEAGTNARDLLAHLNSRDTARSVKKYLHRDLSVAIANGRSKGQDALEVFAGLLQDAAMKDKNYVLLKNKLANTQGDDARKKVLGDMLDAVKGSAIGKIVHNQQELMALMAVIGQMDKYKSNKDQILNHSTGLGDKDSEVIKETADYKTERAKSIGDIDEKDALRGFSHVVGDTADKLANYAAEYPGLTSAVMGAKVAFEGVTQAIIAIGLGRLVFGGGAGAAAGEAAGGAGAGGGAAAGAGLGALFARLRMGLGIGGGAVALANFTTDEEDEETRNGPALWKRLKAQYSQQVIDAARKKYQPWYQFGNGYAAENEQWIKQYLADQQRDKVSQRNAVNPMMPGLTGGPTAFSQQLAAAILKAQTLPAATKTMQPITINNQIHLDGHVIAEQVNQINAQSALRH